jgi:integrase
MLTKRTVDALSFDPSGPATQIHFANGDIPGFGLRLFPSGARSYVVWLRTTSGQKRLHTLGKHGVVTVQMARELARTTLADASRGLDPQQARQQARMGDSIKEFAEVYLNDHAREHKKSWEQDQWRLGKHVLPKLGNRKLKDLSRSEVSSFYRSIGATSKAEANRCLALLSAMYKKAIEWQVVPEDFINPARGIQKYVLKSRDRWVQDAELPAFWSAVEGEPDIFVRAAISLLILTGLRKSEMLTLEWKHVDLHRKEFRLEETKNGQRRYVPLNGPAVDILRSLPRALRNTYVFPGEAPGTHRSNLDKAWRRCRARMWLSLNPEAAAELREQAEADVRRRPKRASRSAEAIQARLLELTDEHAGGSEGIRLHDLRRSCGSHLAADDVSLQKIGAVLGHKSLVTTRTYARLSESATVAPMEALGARLFAMR